MTAEDRAVVDGGVIELLKVVERIVDSDPNGASVQLELNISPARSGGRRRIDCSLLERKVIQGGQRG